MTMKKKTMSCVAWGLAVASAASAQLVFERPADSLPVTGLLDVGSSAPGDTLDTRLRVRNTGTAVVELNVLKIDGVGFTLEGTPSLPQIMAPGVNADFRVRFRPVAPGSHSATLRANSASLLVRGSSTAGLVLLRDGLPVTNLQTLEFGAVFIGQRARIALTLRNDSPGDATVRQLSVSGAGFSLAPTPLPSLLRAGEEAPFELRCEPVRAGLLNGTLQLDGRSFAVVALGREPEAPSALIELDTQAARSGKQSTVRIRLAAPATMAVTGTLRLEFTASVNAGAGGDAAIQFLANSSRSVPVQVAPGDSVATVAGKPEAVFQTGTTAGSLALRLMLGTQERVAPVTIPPEAPMIDTIDMRRETGAVEVTLTGFDNHRSAGNVVFTFTDQSGQELPAVSAEAAQAFSQHFRDSTMGGLFRLTARFPVTGDASKLARVAVKLANAIGAGSGRSE